FSSLLSAESSITWSPARITTPAISSGFTSTETFTAALKRFFNASASNCSWTEVNGNADSITTSTVLLFCDLSCSYSAAISGRSSKRLFSASNVKKLDTAGILSAPNTLAKRGTCSAGGSSGRLRKAVNASYFTAALSNSSAVDQESVALCSEV